MNGELGRVNSHSSITRPAFEHGSTQKYCYVICMDYYRDGRLPRVSVSSLIIFYGLTGLHRCIAVFCRVAMLWQPLEYVDENPWTCRNCIVDRRWSALMPTFLGLQWIWNFFSQHMLSHLEEDILSLL